MHKIAVLITCYNRKHITLNCLSSLYKSFNKYNANFDIYLVDDGSTDGTSTAVSEKFPSTKIIQGTGSLFWNQGMRLAWDTALKSTEYDFYIWLNDDTILDVDAVENLFDAYSEAKHINKDVIIVGVCRNSEKTDIFSYGGRDDNGPIIPNGFIQECKYINGNIVLISNKACQKIGNLSNNYTHSIGDFDYGLKAQNVGIRCYITKKFIATCSQHLSVPNWSNPNLSLKNRYFHFKSPLGLCISEYTFFRKKFWPKTWYIFIFKAYFKLLFPSLHKYLK